MTLGQRQCDKIRIAGLGDASASLPVALRQLGIDVRVLLPAYARVLATIPDITWLGRLPGRGDIPGCRIGMAQLANGTTLYLVGAPSLYDRPGTPYVTPEGRDWSDNHLRWGRLSLAAAQIARGPGKLGWRPDVVHANDWPCGLAPAYLRWDGTGVASVPTIHNISYQGQFAAHLRHGLGIPDAAFDVNGVEFHGAISFLKAGSFYDNDITTVSPTYGREITTEQLGGGLHGLMQTRAAAGQLSGIINGIDASWNAAEDPYLPYHFDTGDLTGKRSNADVVRTCLCLRPSDGPLFGIVARLVHQKGLDLVAEAASSIVEGGGQIAVLGLGDAEIEHVLSRAARRYRDDMAILVGFNEPMARRIIAASDFFLMPSRFEPCGLTQMQAQRYGALPIAHAVGGLVDTIEDGVTGFLFADLTVDGLATACRRAFNVFVDGHRLRAMRHAAMTRCFSWSASAAEYVAVYRRHCGDAVPRRLAPPATAPRHVEMGRVAMDLEAAA
jgi:starch synthase